MNQTTNPKTIGYVRVNTQEQAEIGLSLASQRAKIEAYGVATDLDLVTVIEDAGESATSLSRPRCSGSSPDRWLDVLVKMVKEEERQRKKGGN